jgi:acetylornithine deacetylase/succinyl-diaminopimelate desuccinylase-like protein
MRGMMRGVVGAIAGGVTGVCLASSSAADAPENALARSIFKELIEINTTDSVGSVTLASEAMAKRLLEAGYPAADVRVLGPNERKKNLVVRLRGTGKHKPVLLIGHLDVVEARREDWTTDPFRFLEQDGYFYGRGTLDMKDGDAIMVTTLIRLKKEGFKPSRDIILALTADEEGGSSNGVDWLLRNHRELLDAQFVLNHDGFSVISDHGTEQFYELDATEKIYADYQLSTTHPGGHSSLPVPENAIYELAQGLTRISAYEFPVELNGVTRGYYEQMAKIESGQRAADMRAILQPQPDPAAVQRLSHDPLDHSTMRTTCVATRLEGGHANNALPQRAQAIVNCRILPGHSPEEVRQKLIEVLSDPGITVRYVADDGQISEVAPDRRGFPPPPPDPQVMTPLKRLVDQMWPGLTIVPRMATGATDGVLTTAAGLPTYTVTGIAVDRSDIRMHGRDERVGVGSFYRGNEFFYRYLRALTER